MNYAKYPHFSIRQIFSNLPPHLSRVTSLENNLFPKYLLKVADFWS